MRRPPIWKRQYLLEPKLQLGITFYFLIFTFGALGIIYWSVRQTVTAILEHTAQMSNQCTTLITDNEDSIRTILTVVFGTNAFIVSIFALVGGILISHRIAGPLYRFKAVIRQIADGEDPGEIRVRKSDYFADIVPLLQDLQKSRKTVTEKEKV
jgi:nitrogen fixation/metabolism regulation signal transduction histidine kinase